MTGTEKITSVIDADLGLSGRSADHRSGASAAAPPSIGPSPHSFPSWTAQGAPHAGGTGGTELFYLVGHGPTALWLAKVTADGLKDAKMLNADVGLSGFAG